MTKLPKPFIIRRLHSLLGLWLVVYLTEHLFVNAQMALFFVDDGSWFIDSVNRIHALPFLPLIEIAALGVPFLLHGIWGIFFAKDAKLNAHKTDGTKPSLSKFRKNRAFSWQRVTSWILVVGILAHVVHMRFLDYPEHIQGQYTTQINVDPGLVSVAQKIGVTLENPESGKITIKAPNAGSAFFLIIRQAFTSPILVILYSLLVITAVYHAFNGLWTLMITWGICIGRRSQIIARILTTTLMAIVMFFGLISAWGTYWGTLFLR